jgi:nitrilase
MTTLTVAAVQAAHVLMDREATVARVEALTTEAAGMGADLVVFPEVFVPGTPIWIDAVPIWDGDDKWFAALVDQAVVVPSETTDRLCAAARDAGVYLVVGINEREPTGSTIYNTVLYMAPDGGLLGRHRKLMPTGSERTVWGMGDGSTLDVYATPLGRLGGLICWENYMPLARFYLYSQGVDIWLAPTLAVGDGWIATMRHIAREGRCYVVGVNPCLIGLRPRRSIGRRWTPSTIGSSRSGGIGSSSSRRSSRARSSSPRSRTAVAGSAISPASARASGACRSWAARSAAG